MKNFIVDLTRGRTDTLLLLIALWMVGSGIPAQAQNSTPIPTVLGCMDPAPAAPGKPTVFISKCNAPRFLPTTTTSVIASGTKEAPAFAHTFTGYPRGFFVIACPKGANVQADQCTDATGKDVSVLATVDRVPGLILMPPLPGPPVPRDYTVTIQGVMDPSVAATFKALDSSRIQCFVVTSGPKTAQVCL